ncbi:MAG: cyclic nucleotide-binding protein [Alcanivoracaceae bacterium]|uniref:Crp/Fnr family transcriptional regulator n=1 Tax=Alcanivorax sp. MD8A TaxID=1177157 RepID=UPI000C533880|nr:cyclic nucleotide-binding domain-containing protein [Alcanivorax sp. MD8A]MAX55257.1 cyclic nucleotide-binding protein [Alcanivoracaceae bacterium]MCG8437390.1 cyclic nucleotide-binding domain-containing protein [Pseudomonadales bacterium]MED5430889.1 cyclic nucleotide-binding domain-containing protein [Pseudomonadota bacterium]MEE2868914.1 cyclic nucleotide-binding domain-containing protein [Pseudomonadota bacterium]PNE03135.1 cyclic nucleotide-binding protein [Alcanivorax sp. MD8A]
MSQVIDILSRMRLFAGLSEEELRLLEKLVFVNRVPVGETVCREGDRSDFVCFVVRGCLDIVKQNVEGGEVVIAHLRPGDSMGEMALVDHEPRSATVKAAEDATLIVLTRKGLDQLRRRSPNAVSLVMENIARLLCVHLRRTSSQLAQFKLPVG